MNEYVAAFIALVIFAIVILIAERIERKRPKPAPTPRPPRYSFELQWSGLSYQPFYAAVKDHQSVLYPGSYEVVHSKHFKTAREAERWLEDRAAFLGQTEYTVNKRLTKV